jgi:predicted transcriptional regulator
MDTFLANVSATGLPRLFSLRMVVEMIVTAGPITRAEISRRTGLSKQAVSEVARQLEDAGWIGQVGRTHGQYRPHRRHLSDRSLGRLCHRHRSRRRKMPDRPCRSELPRRLRNGHRHRAGGGTATLRHITSEIDRLIAKTGIDRTKIQRAVIGCPGTIDPRSGRLSHSPSVPDLSETDIAGSLSTLLGVPTTAENDVNLAVLGEHWQGPRARRRQPRFRRPRHRHRLGLIINGKLRARPPRRRR